MGRLIKTRKKVSLSEDTENFSPAETVKTCRRKAVRKKVELVESKATPKAACKKVEIVESKITPKAAGKKVEIVKSKASPKAACKKVDVVQSKATPKNAASSSLAENDKQDKKICKPVYLTQKKSLTRRSLKDIEDRLQLYDFEVDENEPVVNVKKKRKPIVKIKKHRTYTKKINYLPERTINLEDSGKENLYPSVIMPVTSKKTPVPPTKTPVPLAEISNIHIEDGLCSPIDAPTPSKRLTLYSPQPYRSPKRDSLSVPVVRTSDCNMSNNSNISSRSLNVSINNSKHDKTSHSAYDGSFMNRLFMGSSTPIRHWADDSDPSTSEKTVLGCDNFDLSNNFGFEADNSIDEPFISPIKTIDTLKKCDPPKSPKESPVKIPFKHVIKMLKFGRNVSDSDMELSFEGLPDNFYHDADTPTFSPSSIPSTPELPKKVLKNICPNTKKKKTLAFKEETDDSGNLTQSSEDKENYGKCEIVYANKKKNIKKNKDECDKGYETEDQVLTKRPARRSYERPAYLRSKKKVGLFGVEVVEEEAELNEVTVSAKTSKKKPGGLTKKEEIEMEKWAKAFNEQCMQVENFNLCVE